VYRGRDVLCVSSGPGGLVMACLSQRASVASGDGTGLELSVWVLGGGMTLAGSADLSGCVKRLRTADNHVEYHSADNPGSAPVHDHTDNHAAADSLLHGHCHAGVGITWHPSGNHLYALFQGTVHLFRVRWIDRRLNKHTTLAEFYSCNLSENDCHHGNFSVSLSPVEHFSSSCVTSLCLIDNASRCVIGCDEECCVYLCMWNLQLVQRFSSLPAYSVLNATRVLPFSFSACPTSQSSVPDSTIIIAPTILRICEGTNRLGLVAAVTSTSSLLLLRSDSEGDVPVMFHSPMFRPVFHTHCEDSISCMSRNNNSLWRIYEACCMDTPGSENDSMLVVCLSHCERIHRDREATSDHIATVVELVVLKINYEAGSYSIRVHSRRPVVSDIDRSSVCPPSQRKGRDLPRCLVSSSLCIVRTANPTEAATSTVVLVGSRVMCFPLRAEGYSPLFESGGESPGLGPTFSIDIGRASSPSQCLNNVGMMRRNCMTVASGRLVIGCGGDVLHNVTLLVDPTGTVLSRPFSSGALLNISAGQLLLLGSSGRSVGTLSEAGEGEDLFPFSGKAPFHSARLPRSLLHDLIINTCSWKPVQTWHGVKPAGSALYSLGGSLRQGCGLVVARQEGGSQAQGRYIACCMSPLSQPVPPCAIHSGVKSAKSAPRERQSPLLWIYSVRTSKWKSVILPARPPMSSIVLLSFRDNGGAVPRPFTRKQYSEAGCGLDSVEDMRWFGDHSLCVLTLRSAAAGDKSKTVERDIPAHWCLELMSRSTGGKDPVVVTSACWQAVPGLRQDTRRLCTPGTHRTIPLPEDFRPNFMDVVDCDRHIGEDGDDASDMSTSSHSGMEAAKKVVLHGYEEEDVVHLRRSLNRSYSSGAPMRQPARRKSFSDCAVRNGNANRVRAPTEDWDGSETCFSCIVLLGSASRFIAIHVTANQCAAIFSARTIGKCITNVGGMQSYGADRFTPTSYDVCLLWDIDLSKDVAYGPNRMDTSNESVFTSNGPISDCEIGTGDTSRPHRYNQLGSVTFPLQCALVLPVHLESNTRHPSSTTSSRDRLSSLDSVDDSQSVHGMSSWDVGMVILDADGKVVKVTVSACQVNGRKFCRGVVVNKRGCCAIVRLGHGLLPRTGRTPRPLKDIFLLLSSSVSSRGGDLLWLPNDCSPLIPDSEGGTVLPAPIRDAHSKLVSQPNDNLCAYLSHSSALHLPSEQSHSTTPVLTLQHSFMPLSLILGLLNLNHSCPSSLMSATGPEAVLVHMAGDDNTLADHMTIPYHTYSASSLGWMKFILSHVSRHPVPLQQLADGMEMALKALIDRPGFSRHSPEFAILTSVLFACDDVLFIEVLSRLSRKLEPCVSASLFPLPNCRLSSLRAPKLSTANIVSGPRYRHVSVDDSPWDQLTIFEFCLTKGSLTHAARFLTLACEQMGGSQSVESVAVSLILSIELLWECLRHLSLDNCLECIDFCARLDVMAAELIYRQERGDVPRSVVMKAVHTVGEQLVESVSLLTPLIGPDLHVLMQDAFSPHNPRTYTHVDLFHRPLYWERATRIRRHCGKSHTYDSCVDTGSNCVPMEHLFRTSANSSDDHNPQTAGVRGICIGESMHVYYAFSSVVLQSNPAVETYDQDRLDDSEPHLERIATPYSEGDIQVAVEGILRDSYTGGIVSMACRDLIATKKWYSCAIIMASINTHLLTSNSSTVSWLERSLFMSHHSSSHESPIHNSSEDFKSSSLYQIVRSFELQHIKIVVGSPLNSVCNRSLDRVFSRTLPEFELRKRCETEMFVSFAENTHDGGCLVNLPCLSGKDVMSNRVRFDARDRCPSNLDASDDNNLEERTGHTVSSTQSMDESAPRGGPGFTAVPLHGRAASKFSVPTFSKGKALSVEQLLRGLAAAAWMVDRIDVVLLVAVLFCRQDVATACLHWQSDDASHKVIIDFFLDRRQSPAFEECVNSTSPPPADSPDSTNRENNDSPFINQLFVRKSRAVGSIALDIFNYYYDDSG